VNAPDATCWTLIHAAAGGDGPARDYFARLYEPIARAYFVARWKQSPVLACLDDAVQDVFIECFKSHGVLDKATDIPTDGFRIFFHGVLRNIARRHESTRKVAQPLADDHAADETSLSRMFDRAWALSLLKEAARVQSEIAAEAGERAVKRVELLRLRFQEGLPIRAIGERWNEDPAKLHHEYATARDEFRAALMCVMAFHQPGAVESQLATACREVLALLN
jgi:hypothetical protein